MITHTNVIFWYLKSHTQYFVFSTKYGDRETERRYE